MARKRFDPFQGQPEFLQGDPWSSDPFGEEDMFGGMDPADLGAPPGPDQALYARAAMGLGLDVAQVQSIWETQLGATGAQGKSSYDLWSALESHVRATQFGGGPIGVSGASMWQFQHSGAALQEILKTRMPVPESGEVPEGWMQYGKRMWPAETVTAALGVGMSQAGELSFGLSPEKAAKAVKMTRGAPGVQEHQMTMSGLPAPTPGYTMGSTATQPEMMQTARAFVSFDQPMAEGKGVYDPGYWGHAEKPVLERVRLPETFDVTKLVQPGAAFSGEETATFFEGHVGKKYSQYDRVVVNAAGVISVAAEEAGGREYQQLIVQMAGVLAEGAMISSKAGATKAATGPAPVAQMFGDIPDPVGAVLDQGTYPRHFVQSTKPITAWFQGRDPEQLAALHTRQMTPEQQVSIYGREVPKWDPDLYQTWHEKVLTPGLQETWLEPRAFNLRDPRTQERLKLGKLVETERIDEYTIMAKQKTIGIALDLGMQQSMVWEHQKGRISHEMAADISRTHPEMGEYYSALSRARQQTVANIGGAAMFNVGEASGYQTTPIGDQPWASLTALAMGRLEEQGVKEPMRALPGQLGAALMMEMGKEAGKGTGLMFPRPGGGQVAMPNPAAVEAYLGGAPVEGMRFGLSDAMSRLLGTYQKWQSGTATEKQYGAALTRAEEQLAETTSSAGFGKALTEWNVGRSALTGGRVMPTEGLPMDRFTASRQWLEQHMQFEPGLSRGERGRAVSDVMAGKEDFHMLLGRHPMSLSELQTRHVVRYMGPGEAREAMGMSAKEYRETHRGGIVGMAPAPAAVVQKGDFDVDPYFGLAASVVEKDPETGDVRHRRLASGGLTEKQMIAMAETDVGGEFAKDMAKISATEAQSIEGILEVAAKSHVRISPAELTRISVEAEAKSREQGPVYNLTERQLKWAAKQSAETASQEGNIALRMAAEEMGEYYLAAQSRGVSLAGDKEAATGFDKLLDLYRSASTASGGGISGGEGIYYHGPAGMIGTAFEAVSEMEKLSPRSKAAMLMDPDLPGAGRLQEIMEQTGGMKPGAKRGRLLGEAIGIAMPEQQTFAAWGERSVLGRVVGGAVAARGQRELERYPEGKPTASGMRVYTPSEATQELAAGGTRRQNLLKTLYSGEIGQRPLAQRAEFLREAAQDLPKEEAAMVQRAVEAISPGRQATSSAAEVSAPATTQEGDRFEAWAQRGEGAGHPDLIRRQGTAGSRSREAGNIWDLMTLGGQQAVSAGVSAEPAPGTATTAPPLSTQAPSPVSGMWEEAGERITRALGGVDPASAEAGTAMAALAQRSLGGRDVEGGQTVLRQELNAFIAAHPDQAAEAQRVWQARLPAGMTMGQFGETQGHQYQQFLQQRAAGGAGGTTGGPPSAGGAVGGPPGGGQYGKGWKRWTVGPEGWSAQEGFSTQTELSPKHEAIMGAMEKYEDALSKRAAQLGEELAAGKNLTKESQRTATTLVDYHSQMQQAVQIAKSADRPDIQARAQGALQQLEAMGMPAMGAQAQVQRDLMGMGAIEPQVPRAQEAAGGAFRAVFSGWEMMRMKRMWGMTGGPVFQQMIPAAAQAEMPGWQATVAMGGFQPGMAPGGVAGGLMAYQAAQRQGQIEAGRTGYRAWSWAMKPMTGLKQAQAMFGPALGVGAIAGSIAGIAAPMVAPGAVAGMSAAGIAGAVSLPIAVGVAGVLGAVAIGASAYQAGGSTAENALRLAEATGQPSPGAGGMWEGGVGAGAGGVGDVWQRGMTRAGMIMRGGGRQQRGGIEGAMRQQVERGRGLWTQQMGEMSTEDRMAAINAAAQGLQGSGGVWDIMDEPQIAGLIGQFAAYKPDMTAEEIAQGPEWLEQAAVTGRTPQRYAGIAGQLGMDQEGAYDLYQRWGGLSEEEEMRRVSAAGALAPMARFGATPESMLGRIDAGWQAPRGQMAAQWQQALGGDQSFWSRQARAGDAPGWMGTREATGLPVGTTDFGQLRATSVSGAGARAQFLTPGTAQGTFLSAGGQGAWGGMPQALMSPTGGRLPLSGGGFVDTPVGGQWGLQDWQTAEQREYQDFQAGQQYRSLFAQRGLTLQQRGFEDQQRGMAYDWQQQQFGFQQRGMDMSAAQFGQRQAMSYEQMAGGAAMWQEDRATQFGRQMTRFDWREWDLTHGRGQQLQQREYQREDLGTWWDRTQTRLGWQGQDITRQYERGGIRLDRAEERLGVQWGRQETQFAQSMADMARGWGQQQTQMQWGREDFQFQQAGAQLQFGWQMEDIEENIRFATGRQRKQLITQRERAATMFGRQEGRAQTEEERMDQREQWATEEHVLAQDRMTERQGWAQEDFEHSKEQLEEQRDWLDEDHERATERWEQRKEWASEDYLTRLERLDDLSATQDEIHDEQLRRLEVQRGWAQTDYTRDIEQYEIRLGWQEDQMELQQAHFLERQELSQEQHDAGMAHYEEQFALETEIVQVRREFQDGEFAWAVESLNRAEKHRGVLRDIQDIQTETARQQQMAMSSFLELLSEGSAFLEPLNRVANKFQEIANTLAQDEWR